MTEFMSSSQERAYCRHWEFLLERLSSELDAERTINAMEAEMRAAGLLWNG